jgi:hypothetical protein
MIAKLGPHWREMSKDLYVNRSADEGMVGTIFSQDMHGREPRRDKGQGFTEHDYSSEMYQQFLVEDVLRLERDSSVLVITSEVTPGMLQHSIPPAPASNATPEQLRRYNDEIEERKYLIRRTICVNSQWRMNFNMFPLRESSVRCPFRAICFLVPSQLQNSSSSMSSGGYSSSMHFSVLVYYVNDPNPQEDLGALIRTYISRPTSETRERSSLSSEDYVSPRMYHYDSTSSQLNRRLARALAENLAKVGLILDQRGEVDVIQGVRDPSNEGFAGEIHFQTQPSCASWSVAYAEKIQDSILRQHYGDLPDSVIRRMNEVCSTRLNSEAYKKLILTGTVYHMLLTDFVIGDARVYEIARRLERIIRFDTIGGKDDDRLLILARALGRIYFDSAIRAGERRDRFVYKDDVNLHSDLIRMYLAFDFAVPEDVMFGVGESGLVNLAKRWTLAVEKHIVRSSRERVSGHEYDRVLTGQYHRKVGKGLPRMVVWLQLPEDTNNSKDFPALIVFRPLYRSTFDSKPGVLLNTVTVYSVNSVEEKNDVLTRFLNAIRSVLPSGTDQPAPAIDPLLVDTGSFDDIIHLQLKAEMGRYYVIDLMRSLTTTDFDVPDTATRCNELAQLVTEQNPLDLSDRNGAAEQNMPMGFVRKDSDFTMYISRRFRRQLYGRLLYILAEQEPLIGAPVNLDTEPYVAYSKIPVRENASQELVSTVKRVYGEHLFRGPELFTFKPRWQDRTRRIWTASYFNTTFRGALEAAVYQQTRGIDPLVQEALRQADDPALGKQERAKRRTKIGHRIIQACPVTTKLWISNPAEEKYELPFLAMIGEDWIHVRDVLPPAFATIWTPFFPRDQVPVAPSSASDYFAVPLRPFSDYAYKIDRDGHRYGILQFPVIVQGEYTGAYHPCPAPIDIWDVLGATCTDAFWVLTEKIIDERARFDFTALALGSPFSFDASARVLQHDPFIHVVMRNYNLGSGRGFLASAHKFRAEIPKSLNLRELCDPTKGRLHKISNFSYADVALLAILAIQAQATAKPT